MQSQMVTDNRAEEEEVASQWGSYSGGNYKTNVHIGIICSVASYWLHKSIADSQQTLPILSYWIIVAIIFSTSVSAYIPAIGDDKDW